MNIAIVDACIPFVSGPAEDLAETLRRQLVERGHHVLPVRIPFQWEPVENILDQVLACRLMMLSRIDRMIAFRFPAYCVPHPNKIVWFANESSPPVTGAIGQVLIDADRVYLSQAHRVFTGSPMTAARLKEVTSIESEILYPPLARPGEFFCAGYGGYFFWPNPVLGCDRQALVLESMKLVESGARLVIGANRNSCPDLEPLARAIREHGLESKVRVLPSCSTKDRTRWYANATGCINVPCNDASGDVVLEAFHSRKPVIACRDEYGFAGLVRDGETGRVVESRPSALAAAMDELFNDIALAETMGNAGFKLLTSLGIHWDRVTERLLS